ncbi:MAG: asparagine synthase (glutamine-hydrolyzing) [Acidobacteria bacterium]|jgi:asparagine synthase (glutamine-hydrolysing)|nr:asparagine synthase (glutamine-hydrolyzing) [Acidobacteriota bacterium]
MCGICGFFQTPANTDAALLKKMSDQIIHRGPDDEGFFSDAGVGLAARRLSIIDLATGHQPLRSRSGDSWIAYNGEVYNFQELRADLEGRGCSFRTQSDTEVVVNLYEEYGLEFVKKLRGMFAFAIFDRRNRRLVLARDPIGKKPLYYSLLAGGGIVFASEIKSILQFPGIARDVDPEALDFFLTLEYVPAPHSIFRSVRKLPAGHVLVYEQGRAAIHEYWDVHPGAGPGTFARARDEFLGLLEEAVRLRMISDVPLGAFLSGGIDSSAVVAFMARSSTRPIQTFSIGFEEKSYSELPHARRVAEKFKTDHCERTLTADIRALVDRLARSLDEPLGDFSNFPTYLVSRVAREKVTVALSGDGGDEVFGGYEHYAAQKLARFVDPPLLRCLPALAGRALRLLPPTEMKKGAVNRLKRFSEGFANSPANRHFRWMLFLTEQQKARLYTPEFLARSGSADLYAREPFRTFFERSRQFAGINRDLYLDLKTYLADDIMVKVDRMSMAASLETRAPLLDRKLVEFAFSLPPQWKVRGNRGKWFFKKAMEGILDHETIYRQKEGFSIPIKNWLKTDLKDLMLDTLAKNKIDALGYFSYPTIEKLIEEHLANRENHAHRLWALMQFHLWHDHFARG